MSPGGSASRRAFPAREVAAAAGARPIEWAAVASGGYGQVNAHWRVSLADGRSVFVKHALTRDAADWLRKERLVYESVRGGFMPAYLGSFDDGVTLLVLDDLSGAEWPPPWSPERIDAVLGALEAVRAMPPPSGIESLEATREELVGWGRVAADPEPLLATGLCSRSWLERALPELIRASADAELGGNDLVHSDVRSDNLCLVDGRAILFDWNLACTGNGDFDVAFWLPSLQLEGGPAPWEVLPDAGGLAAVVAGFFSARAGLSPPSGAPTVREFQHVQAAVALPWAARELGLPSPS
jgi:hypothetical protein